MRFEDLIPLYGHPEWWWDNLVHTKVPEAQLSLDITLIPWWYDLAQGYMWQYGFKADDLDAAKAAYRWAFLRHTGLREGQRTYQRYDLVYGGVIVADGSVWDLAHERCFKSAG